jgi:hypothetical protein
MSYYEEAIAIGYPDCDESLFVAGMIRVGKGRGERIFQYCRRLVEIDSVFLMITGCLRVVPSKNHAASIRSSMRQRAPKKAFTQRDSGRRVRLYRSIA